MTEHSKEPWKRLPGNNHEHIIDANGTQIAWWHTYTDDLPRILHTKNATRLCACVNALAGLNPEHVGELVEGVEKALSEFLTEGRSGVYCDDCGGVDTHSPTCTIAPLQALLAKVKA